MTLEAELADGDSTEVDIPMTAEERAELERYGLGRTCATTSQGPLKESRFQARRFFAPATQNGDPIQARFNDDELRMLGPVLQREYSKTEPPISILDQLPTRVFDLQRILRTVVEYCMYRGWLTLGVEASRRMQSPDTLQLWAKYLDEETRPEEAAEVRRLIRESLGGDS
ncbi:hypothetical protein A2598_04525 [Candidatus Peribacteria bacterium RIFOXYD1_FULL_54_13]|nr:MAG: hypothetical protein A2598_04525 [Candidatus Peribacteria bacterium RIFOXYD1_FULL_54_13]